MLELANMLMLALIVLLLLGSVLRSDRLLSALFLIGFTQIGGIYPVLGKIRFELVVGILLLLAIGFSSGGMARLKPDGKPIARYFYYFVLVVLLSIPFSVAVPDSTYWLFYYFKRCFILFLGALALLDEEKKIRSLLHAYLAGIFWLAFCAVYDYVSGIDILMVNGVQRVSGATGLLSNPNGMANTLVGALPLAYYLILYYWRKSMAAWILVAACIVSLTAIFMSGSRGGFIGLMAAFCFSVLLAKKRSRAFVIVLIVLTISMVFIGDELLGRYATIIEGTRSGDSANSRLVGLQHGFNMLVRRPILGVGIGAYPVARGKWFGWNFWAHNTYGQLMGELGLAGSLVWGFLVFYTVHGARRIRLSQRRRFEDGSENFLYYLSIAIEVTTYTRLVLGMTTHSLHIFFWYLNAALVVCMQRVLETRQAGTEAEG